MRLFSRFADCLVWIMMLGRRESAGTNMRSALSKDAPPAARWSAMGLSVPQYSRQFRRKMPTTCPFGRSEKDLASAAALSISACVTDSAFPSPGGSPSLASRRSRFSSRSHRASVAPSIRSITTVSPSTARFKARNPVISTSSPPQATVAWRHVFMCMRKVPWKSLFSFRPRSTSLALRCGGYTEPSVCRSVSRSFRFSPRGADAGVDAALPPAASSASASRAASFSPHSGNCGRMRWTNSRAVSAAMPSATAFAWQARSSVSSNTSGPTAWRLYQCATRRIALSLRSFCVSWGRRSTNVSRKNSFGNTANRRAFRTVAMSLAVPRPRTIGNASGSASAASGAASTRQSARSRA
mmetsp:Transcript_43394/g.131152  ORF Transcript_43394/g.131152 Transcript_43394/m.131152 type:complete len:354 (+) Transcript_43394:1816-2877(+)